MISFDCPILEPSRQIRLVEQHAADCLAQCCRGAGLSELPLPIPVERWIERPLGHAFCVMDLSHLGDDVLGATFIAEREIAVSTKLTANEGRLRFTAAHELGHVWMHGQEHTRFTETPKIRNSSESQIERQADRFAAAFLMPIATLMPQLLDIARYFDLDIKACIPLLCTDEPESIWLWRNRFLPRLTTRYNVSVSAMVHRFLDVRLKKGLPFIPVSLKRQLLRSRPASPEQFHVVDGVPVRLADAQGSLF